VGVIGEWLIDKSALTRLPNADTAWLTRIERGLVCVSTVTKLEIGHSARSGDHFEALFDRPPLASMPTVHLTPRIEDRAVEVHRLLGRRGHHRGPSVADLLIAATGEFLGLTILHVDRDFPLIAEVTGQPVEEL
jgi:predicted nucleic acid-binding protein